MAVFKRKSEREIPEEPISSVTARIPERKGPSIFCRGLKVKGRIKGGEEVRINGNVSGNLNIKGAVIVEPDGHVKADIHAEEVIVRGKVTGNLSCAKATIEPGGELTGDVASPRMMLADGAVFKGKIDMAPGDKESEKGKTSHSASTPKRG